jgi:ribosomal protein S6--L-glutamate ligase
MGFPMIAKLPRSARGEHVALITGRQQLMQWLATCEVLYLQEYLPCERDLRVVWVGDRVVTAYWRVGGDGLHHNLARGAVVDATGVPAAALELVARVASHLGIDHAGFDLLEIGGHCYILELNVLFGFEGINQLGVDLAPVIVDYLRRRLQDDDQPPRPGPAALPLAG